MTHEEQIKWLSDRITHLDIQHTSAMNMVVTLMGKLKSQREWVDLTDEEIAQMGLSNYMKVVRETEAKLKEKNT